RHAASAFRKKTDVLDRPPQLFRRAARRDDHRAVARGRRIHREAVDDGAVERAEIGGPNQPRRTRRDHGQRGAFGGASRFFRSSMARSSSPTAPAAAADASQAMLMVPELTARRRVSAARAARWT